MKLITTICRSCGREIWEPSGAIAVWTTSVTTGIANFATCDSDSTANHWPASPPADREGLEGWLAS